MTDTSAIVVQTLDRATSRLVMRQRLTGCGLTAMLRDYNTDGLASEDDIRRELLAGHVVRTLNYHYVREN